MEHVKQLDAVQTELFKLAFEKRAQAFQTAQAEMNTRVKPIADAHGVPEGLTFDIRHDDATGTFSLIWQTPDAEQPTLALVDAGEGPEA